MENDLVEKAKIFESPDRERILKARLWASERGAGGNGGLASLLIDLKLDASAVVAGLLMNYAGESDLADIAAFAGGDAASLLGSVMKNARISDKSGTRLEAERIRDTLFAATGDCRALLIALAAKLDNLRGNSLWRASGPADAEKLKAEARACLAVYAPLAVRLGISWIKDELEDLSLKILNREAYQQIKDLVAAKRAERSEFLSRAQETIAQAAAKAGIPVEVSSRAKHFYSIYMKMRKRNKSASEIFDLFGVRILCGNVEQCYTLLGIAHRLWKPVDGCFKDYIAKPKPNGYQSLHTSVFLGGGKNSPEEERALEIQIRTREMHDMAENGKVGHWLYKRGSSRELIRPLEAGSAESRVSWYEDIRREITRKSVFVFTPQGKAVKLPVGATPIDFAYSVHSAVGERCVGAKADGSIVPLHAELKNAQTVEILTSSQARPSVNWLETVKTSRARNKIRAWLEKAEARLPAAPGLSPGERNEGAKKKAPETPPGPLPERPSASAADGELQLVLNRGAGTMRVSVEHEKNMMVRFAGCCRPVAGDPIAGYVSRGRGIVIHRKNCPNLANTPEFAERRVDAEWENAQPAQVKRFKIEARLKADLFSEIEGAARKYQGSLIEGRLRENGGGRLSGFFAIRFERPDSFKMALKKIRSVPGVLSLQVLN